MAVGRRARHAPGADGRAAAAHVLDDEAVPELLREARGEEPRELVSRSARGIRHDERDVLARVLLRHAKAREREEQ